MCTYVCYTCYIGMVMDEVEEEQLRMWETSNLMKYVTELHHREKQLRAKDNKDM